MGKLSDEEAMTLAESVAMFIYTYLTSENLQKILKDGIEKKKR